MRENISTFDASFFSFIEAEVISMDPMQRWLLEVTYEAIENSNSFLFINYIAICVLIKF
jgi:acyl transferase domain-containing protein